MKLLITGSHGLVGGSIIPLLDRHFDVVAVDIEEWDITDRHAGARILGDEKPQWVINLAAMTDVDGCEDHPDAAMKVNGEGPAVVASLCKESGIGLVHFSTDYVFDGERGFAYTEEDVPSPMSAYGITKLAGERHVLDILPSSIVLRAQWLYGHGGSNFISKVVKIAQETGAAQVVDDQRGSPTYAKDLALPLRLLIERERSGIYHVANSGSCSWYEFAKEIFSCLRMDAPVIAISSSTLARKARRPAYSVFDCTKVRRDTGADLRTWQEALREYLAGPG